MWGAYKQNKNVLDWWDKTYLRNIEADKETQKECTASLDGLTSGGGGGLKYRIISLLQNRRVCFWGAYNWGGGLKPFTRKSDLIDFILSNARQFYSSKEDPLGVKGLKNYLP